ncbi:hypothetical protein Desdi_0210 [Desulfitobacterium dichloroeliminans LMG P-21439]|uniref:Uncharacterized protein n=1 Tax=Desulfitobacterium dichloroeliminans (strain LMG P-21439 / DCA1) TaxID=871963 RepID=L0F1M8_DESDL|nr:hypothetical protein [Desulfitobacterium dichloroeliminans]AGA67764.1 hypothetical protein Desdi_0210 [Desulfitobacterium dichloroeliminans LMG P-21439]
MKKTMKKTRKNYLIPLCTILLIFAFIPGCGEKEQTTPKDSSSTTGQAQETSPQDELEKAGEDLEDVLSALATPGWPTGKISDKVPEYPYGEVKNSGDYGDGEYVILISPTNKDELKEYFNLLEGNGYTLSDGDRARLGTLALRFQFNSTDTLQMIVSDAGTSKWPSLPGDLLAPDKGTLDGDVDAVELSDAEKASGNYYSAGFTLVDLTEEDCLAYVQKQVDNGWEGGGDMATKEINIEGVTCDLMLQFVQFYDGQADFRLEAWAK